MTLPPVITSRSNARVKALRAAFSGKSSSAGELVGIEGEHLLAEAVRAAVPLQTVYLREGSEDVLQRTALAGLKADIWCVLQCEIFDSAVDTTSPQGIAATIAIPKVDVARENASGIFLVLEDIQDPGNLGTLIRTAEAFGVVQVFATPATANQWSPKVIRSSAGSVFRVPMERATIKQIRARLSEVGAKLFAAVVNGEGVMAAMSVKIVAPCAIMIGNEGAGLSHEALTMADERVHIPCAIESLNAAIAGAVLLYEAQRQSLSAAVGAKEIVKGLR